MTYGVWGADGKVYAPTKKCATENGFDRLFRPRNVRAIMYAPGVYAIGSGKNQREYAGEIEYEKDGRTGKVFCDVRKGSKEDRDCKGMPH